MISLASADYKVRAPLPQCEQIALF